MSTGYHGYYGFNNTLFFTKPPKKCSESWHDITVKGERQWLDGIDSERSALVVVDMQVGCYNWASLPGKLGQDYANRWNNVVVPNITKIVNFFREKNLIIAYLILDMPDCNPEIVADFAPLPERLEKQKDFICPKYTSGGFASSPIDLILRQNGISTVFFVGTDTAGCVTATMHPAYDLGYQTIMVEDGCLSCREELHDATVKIWTYKGFARTTEQLLNDYPWDCWVGSESKE